MECRWHLTNDTTSFPNQEVKISCLSNTGTVFIHYRQRFHVNMLETSWTLTFTDAEVTSLLVFIPTLLDAFLRSKDVLRSNLYYSAVLLQLCSCSSVYPPPTVALCEVSGNCSAAAWLPDAADVTFFVKLAYLMLNLPSPKSPIRKLKCIIHAK
jgi:hypothetical protein